METAVVKLYEGLFLVDSAEAASDWSGIVGAVEKVLSRAGSEVVSLKKWDDRKLIYDIQGRSRGTYILAYFKCGSDKITSIERDVQLSEQILRVMVLTTDRMSEEDIIKDTPAVRMEKAAAESEIAAAAAAEIKAAEAAAAEIKAAEAAKEAEAAGESEESSDAEVAVVDEVVSEAADEAVSEAAVEPEEDSEKSE